MRSSTYRVRFFPPVLAAALLLLCGLPVRADDPPDPSLAPRVSRYA
jgi:hypothetical protein